MLLLLHGGETASFLGYDLPRLHAMLNDFPAALLVTAVLFELLAAATKRGTFRTVAFWTLMTGVVGAAAAVVTGLLAEDVIEHGEAIHEIMEQHERLGLITLGIFGVLALWHLVRARVMSAGERMAALALMLVGAGFLVATGKEGGEMVFDHGAGMTSVQMEAEIKNRVEGHHHEEGEEHGEDETPPASPAIGDSAGSPVQDTTVPAKPAHEHAPGTPPHND